jgi:tRNA pseudouridine55 synthase
MQQKDFLDATLLVDKPAGWTSFDVVKKVRSLLQIRKIGHAGTLDPLATGLLLLCTGKQTKQISTLQALQKVYTGQIVLGKTTPSMDLETPFTQICSYEHISESMVYTAVASFIGTIEQVPPIYSALQIGGKRAYDMARKGETPVLKPRSVEVYAFVPTAIALPVLSFELVCSKGTYVRSLAHDLGQKLGVGAYLHALRRTQIGTYHVDQAYTIEALEALQYTHSKRSEAIE